MRLYGSVEEVMTMCLVYKIWRLLCLYLLLKPPHTHTHPTPIKILDMDSLPKFT